MVSVHDISLALKSLGEPRATGMSFVAKEYVAAFQGQARFDAFSTDLLAQTLQSMPAGQGRSKNMTAR
jgi:hypothetical protein